MDTTAQLEIPYADGSDPAEVYTTTQAIAERVAELLLGAEGGIAGWAVGDFKVSSRSTSHGRWLLCDGSAKTQAQIEAALSLDAGEAAGLVALWGLGAGSLYGPSGDVTKLLLPDARGRAIVAAGAGPGLSARALAAAFGAETHGLTAAESGLPAHTHTADQPAHNHTASQPAHTHSVDSAAEASHQHAVKYTRQGVTAGSTQVVKDIDTDNGNTYSPLQQNTQAAGAHDHAITVGDATPAITVDSADPAITVAAVAAAAAAAAHNNVQPSLALGHLFVRV